MHVGELAPDFGLNDHTGAYFTLSHALLNGPVVLFFCPAAMSRACTAQACSFRDVASDFAALDAQRVGISMDDVRRQEKFAAANSLDFPLLTDVGGTVAALYGVKRAVDLLRVRRVTFVIDVTGHILEIVSNEFAMHVHTQRALRALRSLA